MKNKTTSLINVLGLSIGISAALVIYLLIQYDYSFDTYEPNNSSIYRIVIEGENWKNDGVPSPLHEAMQHTVTGVENIAPIFQFNDNNLKAAIPKGNNHSAQIFKAQESVVYTNSSYFNIFPHTWLAGNAATSLQNPYNLVLSESRAKLYFPDIEAGKLIGKTVLFNDSIRTTVTGIIKDLKYNSGFEYKAFISISTIPNSNLKENYSWNEWDNSNSAFQTVIKLSPGELPAQVNKQLTKIYKEHNPGPDYAKTILRLQPLNDVHFNTDFNGTASKSTISNLMLLVVFLLLLGAINFINLSTAQAAQRAKEIGIRKTLGSKKSQLILQFLSETFLLTFFTAIVSVCTTPLLFKAFYGFIPEGLHFNAVFNQPSIIIFLLLLIFAVSILAGLYPAFILSKFKPVLVLKNQSASSTGTTRAAWLRKTLIVFQFIIAQIFIIGMLVVDKQVHYAFTKRYGFS